MALPVRTRLRGEKAPQGDLCDDFYLVWAGRAFTGSPLGPSYLRPQPVITATASTTNRNQQEYSENVFIIKRGRVAMCLCTPEGDMRNTMVLDAGCMFGNQTLFDGSPNSCQAEVVSDEAEVYVIPKEEASSRIRDNFQMTHNILMQSNRINRMLLTQIELMSFHHSEGRVCFYLLHLAEQYSEEKNGQKLLYIRFTHQDIAEITGLSRVCVSNIISGLVKDRILMKKSGLYYVVQMDALRQRINDSGVSCSD